MVRNDIENEENKHKRLAITLARGLLDKAIQGN